MAKLTLAGVSDDGAALVLHDEEGVEHTLVIDDEVRQAVASPVDTPAPPTSATPQQPQTTENQMDSALRPRDIQARIRAGESPETVAQAAGVPVERVMAYAAPVLAEREHIAGRAQRSSVRRSTGDSPHRTLGDAVTATLRRANVPSDRVSWDAWRRQDGRWTLTGGYAVAERTGSATFTFDAPGNFVVAENDDARWLIDDLPEAPAAAAQQQPASGLSVVREQPQLGDDALDLAASGTPDAATAQLAGPEDGQISIDDFFQGEDEPPVDGAAAADPEPPVEHPEPARAEGPAEEAPAPRKRRKGRASVPSWDEIMFGGGDQKED